MEDPQDFAGTGTEIHSRYISTAPCVSLRCVTFHQPSDVGRPILFVPGWISLMNSWRYFLPQLTAHKSVIYLESREKYSSRLSCGVSFTIADFVSDIVGAVEQLGLESGGYILAGSSLGATSILESVPELAAQPLGLGLILPNSRYDLPRHTQLLKYLPAPLLPIIKGIAQQIVRRWKMSARDHGQKERFFAAMSAANATKLRDSTLSLYQYSLNWQALRHIQTPALVIGATQDRLHNQAEVRRIAESLPNAEYADLSTFTASHSSQAARALLSFVQRLA